MIDVTILFLAGGHFSTAAIPMEIFRGSGVMWNSFRGEKLNPQFNVTTASVDGRLARTEAILKVKPFESIDDIKKTDLIFVPASGLEFEVLTDKGFDIDDAVERNAGVVPWMRRMVDRGAQLAAVCSGVTLAAAAGLLDGRRATSHWALSDVLTKRYPKVDWQFDQLITEDRGRYCGGGVHASADLSLYLVEKLCGRDIALQCARALVIDMPRSSQIPFAGEIASDLHADEPILKAQDWLKANHKRDIHFDDVAKRFGMSPRNFARRFKAATGQAPLAYLQSLRIAMAKRLFEEGAGSVQEVSAAVGYDDLIFFRNLFKRHVGVSPSQYRQRFGDGRQTAAL